VRSAALRRRRVRRRARRRMQPPRFAEPVAPGHPLPVQAARRRTGRGPGSMRAYAATARKNAWPACWLRSGLTGRLELLQAEVAHLPHAVLLGQREGPLAALVLHPGLRGVAVHGDLGHLRVLGVVQGPSGESEREADHLLAAPLAAAPPAALG